MQKNLSLLIILLIFNTLAYGNKPEKSNAIRYQYNNILNIAYTPDSTVRCNGWFTDAGSWMGFTIPQKDKWVNGFCGPFSLQNRKWFVRSAAKVSFLSTDNEEFTPENQNYLPGEVQIKARSNSGIIEQKMIFANANTTLLEIQTNLEQSLRICGDNWDAGTTFEIANQTIVAKHPSGEMIALNFSSDVTLKCDSRNYEAISTNKKLFITISFIENETKREAVIQQAKQILNNPQANIDAGNARWQGYLSKTLRNDMPSDYQRIAVKSVVTLISNWRKERGGLLHEGVVPSHAVGYFVGFWAWDSWRFSAALSKFAPELAKNQIRAMFDYQLPDGMIIDCIYVNPAENNARDSKPPLAAWAVDEIFTHTHDTAFVKEMYPALLAYHRWWYAKRDHNRNGICEFGSTDGTTEAAAWESGMDNAIRFDNAKMLKNRDDAWSFDQESVDLNAYLALEYKLLKKMAAIIRVPFTEKDRTKNVADYFFDKQVGFFFDRQLPAGNFIRQEGCEAYIPLWTNIASAKQMKSALKLLTDTSKFSTYIPFPTVAADNPKFMPKGYWRGPIWLDQTYFAIKGLRNYGYANLANKYTKQVFDRLQGLKLDEPIHENYGTHTGEMLKAPNFSWSCVHLLMLYDEYKK